MNDTRFHRSYTSTRPSSSSILVRVGERSWHTSQSASETVAEDQPPRVLTIEKSSTAPITLRVMRERIANAQREQQARERSKHWRWLLEVCKDMLFPAGEKRLWSGLRGGLSIGMALGCIVMILFHQVPLLAAGQAGDAEFSVPPTPAVVKAQSTSPQTRVAMELPGLQFVLVEGNGTKQTGSEKPVSINGKQVYALALTKTGAHSFIRSAGLGSSHVQVQDVQLPAKMVPVLGTVDKPTLNRTEQWLSASGSALRSLTAWLSDGGREADAAMALHTALALYPGDSRLAKMGVEPQLHALYKALVAANGAFVHRDRAAAMDDAIQGFDDFMSFGGLNM
ncbi:hypothetical protein [Alicyclobacillus hesperidum]|uniref:hypothetical protein n=1 Tax=Alicyclobacillus hesperidum TaxID=89784 RepID=UPI0002DFFF36|nr:hypothetical protein [Alicyclobacillus hesperidum]